MQDKKQTIKTAVIWCYLIIAVVGILIVTSRFNELITAHDQELTVDIDNLIAEKMNHSIDYMQQSVSEMATVLSYQDILELDQLYEQLTGSIAHSDYVSIGIVAEDGTIYGKSSEQDEMEKWGLIQMAKNTQEVSISEPYRSAITGKLVFTMFSPIYQQEERLGCIFVTYPLSEIQEIANSKVLADDVEIYIMDAFSENIILCSGSDKHLIGNWNSTKLMKMQIAKENLEAYENWEAQMRQGQQSGTVQFNLNGVDYTQVYENIDAMDGWSVVVRIPNSTLSNTMQQFQKVTLIFVSVLIVMSIVLLLILHKWDETEKARFEYMSTHDALTDVYNRNAFDLVVQKHLDEVDGNEKAALIFLDIDYFKKINDNYGHDIGDHALIILANLLKEQFGEDSIIARYGGDEFVMLVKNFDSQSELEKRMEKLKRTMKESKVIDYDDPEFAFHYSAGIAVFPEQGKKFADLVKYADLALYEVKERGRNGYRWYKDKV